MECLLKSDIINVLTNKNISGLGVIHHQMENIQKSVWVFPAEYTQSGIQIEYKPICRKMPISSLLELTENAPELSYFNRQNLELLLQDINSSCIHFIQGDLSFGRDSYYRTFFAFPAAGDAAKPFGNTNPFLYHTGIPYRLDINSMTYFKSNDTLHDSSGIAKKKSIPSIKYNTLLHTLQTYKGNVINPSIFRDDDS